MSTNAVLSWRNWCAELNAIDVISGDFEASAPASNMLTPRTGQVAIKSSVGAIAFESEWESGSPMYGRPVGVLALLNHNIIELVNTGDITISLRDADANSELSDIPQGIIPTREFQSHLIFIVPASTMVDISRIVRVSFSLSGSIVTGRLDPVTGEVFPEPLSIGGLWAGPIWRPERGLKFATPQFGVIEQPRGVRSIGGQFFPQPQPRQRTLSAELTLLEESEAFTELQELAAWSAVSRPVIAIPDISDPELVYRQGIYGYFDNPLNWQHFDATRDNATAKREYRGNFSITEAL